MRTATLRGTTCGAMREAGESPARPRHCERALLVSQDARAPAAFRRGRALPQEVQMAAPARSVAVPAISPRLLAVALLSVGLMLLLGYLVAFDQGAVSQSG